MSERQSLANHYLPAVIVNIKNKVNLIHIFGGD